MLFVLFYCFMREVLSWSRSRKPRPGSCTWTNAEWTSASLTILLREKTCRHLLQFFDGGSWLKGAVIILSWGRWWMVKNFLVLLRVESSFNESERDIRSIQWEAVIGDRWHLEWEAVHDTSSDSCESAGWCILLLVQTERSKPTFLSCRQWKSIKKLRSNSLIQTERGGTQLLQLCDKTIRSKGDCVLTYLQLGQ